MRVAELGLAPKKWSIKRPREQSGQQVDSMWKLALLALLPTWAVLFGAVAIAALTVSDLSHYGVVVLIGAAFGTLLLSFPVSWIIARRMLTRRERRLLDAAGRGHEKR